MKKFNLLIVLARFTNLIGNAVNTVDEMLESYGGHKAIVDSIQAIYDYTSEVIREAYNEIKRLNNELGCTRQELAVAKDNVGQLESTRQSLKDTLRLREGQLDEYMNLIIPDLRNELKQAFGERNDAIEQAKAWKSQLDFKTEEYERLDTQYWKVLDQRDVAHGNIKDLTAQLDEARNTLNKVYAERDTHEAVSDVMEGEAAKYKAELDELKKDYSKLSRLYERRNIDLEASKTLINKLSDKVNGLTDHLNHTKKDKDILLEQYNKLMAERNNNRED